MIKPKKDKEFIRELLKLPEDETLDFKQNISDHHKIAKTLVAFTNTSGGRLVIGVSDQRRIIGIDAAEEIFMLEKAALENCFPPIGITFELYEMNDDPENNPDHDLYVLIAHIRTSDQTHKVKDDKGQMTAYCRKSDRSIPCTNLD